MQVKGLFDNALEDLGGFCQAGLVDKSFTKLCVSYCCGLLWTFLWSVLLGGFVAKLLTNTCVSYWCGFLWTYLGSVLVGRFLR